MFVDFAQLAPFPQAQRALCWPERRLFAIAHCDDVGVVESALAQLTSGAYGLDELAEVLDGVAAELTERDGWLSFAALMLEPDGFALLAAGDCFVWFNRRGTVLPPERTRGTRYLRISVAVGDVAVLSTRGLAGNALFSSFETRRFRDARGLQAELDALADEATEVSTAIAVRVAAVG